MRGILPLVILFLAAFAATWFLSGGSDDPPLAPEGRPVELPGRPETWDLGPPIRTSGNEKPRSATKDVGDGGDEASLLEPDTKPGRIIARIEDEKGEILEAFGFDLRPFQGRVETRENGILEIRDVPPGIYTLSAWGEETLRRDKPGVKVESGNTTHLRFRLKRGIIPAGTIVDSKTRRAVGGATIEFYGGGRCVSGPDGGFVAPYALDPRCLDQITVSHPDYDRFTYHRLTIRDHKKILLALTRGDATLKVRVVPGGGGPPPPKYRLRLWMERGLNIPPDLRKEVTVDRKPSFQVKGIHRGLYQVMLDFPGTDIAARHKEMIFGFGETKEVTFDAGSGITLLGRLKSRLKGPLVTKIELLNEKRLAAITTYSKVDGSFIIKGIEPGAYRLRVWKGNPVVDFPVLQIGSDYLTVVFDLDRARMQVGKLANR